MSYLSIVLETLEKNFRRWFHFWTCPVFIVHLILIVSVTQKRVVDIVDCEMIFAATDGQVCSSWHQQSFNSRQQFWKLYRISSQHVWWSKSWSWELPSWCGTCISL